MAVYVKPIQPTPTLSGQDAKRIVSEVLTIPSKASQQRNKKILKIRRLSEK